ncbi:MAG: putative 26S proteasome regulatory subunit [Trizodia sp. TS-e1964]|nr:MAG: putative 26S proteasome regulatory subunit [Trizodia sp. TS-e1964]
MDSIHTPTVASGPTTNGSYANGINKSQLSLAELDVEKTRLETELRALGRVLDSHKVDMNTSLTTFDGFPRADLDIALIRTTRARIIHLRNDYKSIMLQIEQGLHAHHASQQAREYQAPPPAPRRPVETLTSGAAGPPFAKIDRIATDSPAERAGLREGDIIKRFGEVDWMNHERLTKVVEEVQASEGSVIAVTVLREDIVTGKEEDYVLQLVPRRGWGGRGLLGCHILPL